MKYDYLLSEMMQNVDNAMSDFGIGMPMPNFDPPTQTGSGMGWSALRRPASRMDMQPEPQTSRYAV